MIEDGLMDPAQAGASREEQRRRILRALEEPLRALKSPTPASGARAAMSGPERQMEALRRRMVATEDPVKRIEIADEIRRIARETRT